MRASCMFTALLVSATVPTKTNGGLQSEPSNKDTAATAGEIRRHAEGEEGNMPGVTVSVSTGKATLDTGKSKSMPVDSVNLIKGKSNSATSSEADAQMSKSATASDAEAQMTMTACMKAFAPFPENGQAARNRFIVDLAYNSGCSMDESGASEGKPCKSEVLSLQKLTNARLNAKCSEEASFPDMCGGCLAGMNLRGQDECGLMSQTERKNTIINELQRLEVSKNAGPTVQEYQQTTPTTLISSCTKAAFTDWCAVLESCGAPKVDNCAKLSQQDKKNTFIYLSLMAEKGIYTPTEEALQAMTDKELRSGCHHMSLLQPSLVEIVQQKVEKARVERIQALQDRRARLEEVAASVMAISDGAEEKDMFDVATSGVDSVVKMQE